MNCFVYLLHTDHNMLHDNATPGENDEDTSSNHSSISSTSFGSGDLLHDRSHSTYHRSSTTTTSVGSSGATTGAHAFGGRDGRDYYSVSCRLNFGPFVGMKIREFFSFLIGFTIK